MLPFMDSTLKRWHKFDHAGRRFRILIEQRERYGVSDWAVVKVDEVISNEEVRCFRLSAEFSAPTEARVLRATQQEIATIVHTTKQRE